MGDEPTSYPALHPGDVVQICDQAHPWFPAILTVDQVRGWGCVASVFVPAQGILPNRLQRAQVVLIGSAAIVTEDVAAERAASLETAAQLAAGG